MSLIGVENKFANSQEIVTIVGNDPLAAITFTLFSTEEN